MSIARLSNLSRCSADGWPRGKAVRFHQAERLVDTPLDLVGRGALFAFAERERKHCRSVRRGQTAIDRNTMPRPRRHRPFF
jgi:hypothetical protein